MAGFSVTKIPVDMSDLDANTGVNGGIFARGKRLLQKIINNCPELDVTVVADTTSAYTIKVTWGNHDAGIQLRTSNSDRFCTYRLMYANAAHDDFLFVGTSVNSWVSLGDESYTIEIVRYGDAFIFISVCVDAYPNRTYSFGFLHATDQFNRKGFDFLINGSSGSGYYGFGSALSSNAGVAFSVSYIPATNPNILVRSGATYALPLYVVNSATPGYSLVPDGVRLYHIYLNTDPKTFAERLMKFSVGGRNFITLGNNVCLGID